MNKNPKSVIGFVELDKMIKNDSRSIYFAGLVMPRHPGVHLFFLRLEREHFKSKTGGNEDYITYMLMGVKAAWFVASVPKEYMETAKKLANKLGMRITETVSPASAAGASYFVPVKGPNVFRLEFDPSLGINVSALMVEEDIYVEGIYANKETAAHLN